MSTHHSVETAAPAPIRPPTPLGRKLVRYLLGFGVGTVVGLAPYLGLLEVRGFKPLLTFLPGSMRDTLIPLSAALMGTLAVVIQWYGGERLSKKWLRKLFARTLLTAVLTFVALIVVRERVVLAFTRTDGQTFSYVVGFNRPGKPPCTPEMSVRDCLWRVTMRPGAIEAYWGEGQVMLARLSLIFPYLLFTGSFGLLVGLVILKEGQQEKAPTKRRQRRGA